MLSPDLFVSNAYGKLVRASLSNKEPCSVVMQPVRVADPERLGEFACCACGRATAQAIARTAHKIRDCILDTLVGVAGRSGSWPCGGVPVQSEGGRACSNF